MSINNNINMNIPDNWIDFTSFIEKDNNLKNKYNELENFINNEDKNNKIYPPINLRFNALEKVSPNLSTYKSPFQCT
jgi:uracil DNA glycosylase